MPSYKDKKTGMWYCQFYYIDWKGARRHTCKKGFLRKKDADNYEQQFKCKTQHEQITMNALIDCYIDYSRKLVVIGSIQQTTLDNKENYIKNYIRDYFGDAPAENVNMDVVNNWITDLSQRKRTKSIPPHNRILETEFLLSSSTINNARSVLSQIFEYGIKTHRVSENPVQYSEHPKSQSNNKRAKLWTLAQYQQFYATLRTEERRVLYNTLFWTGARIGEVLALTPADFTPYKVSITKTWIERKNGECYIKPSPKNKYSVREIEIPHALYFQVKAYIDSQYGLKDTERIFDMTAQSVREHLYYWMTKLGLPRISPHTIRHSYASMLLDATGDIMLVSSQLGHSNIITTGKVYTHSIPGKARAGIDKLEEATRPTNTVDIE